MPISCRRLAAVALLGVATVSWAQGVCAQAPAQAPAPAAVPAPAPPSAPVPAPAPAPAQAGKASVAAKQGAPSASAAVFPAAPAAKYAKEKPGAARMHTCLDQYHANKPANANGGLKWIQKGGGYYSACLKKMKMKT